MHILIPKYLKCKAACVHLRRTSCISFYADPLIPPSYFNLATRRQTQLVTGSPCPVHADLLFLVAVLYLPGNVSFEDGNLLNSNEIKSGFLYVCIILLISLIAIIIAFTLFFALTILELSYINPIHPASSP